MQDTHNVPIQPDRPPQGTGLVLQRPPARPGLRIGAVLAGLLALVLAFSAGLVSGCQVRTWHPQGVPLHVGAGLAPNHDNACLNLR